MEWGASKGAGRCPGPGLGVSRRAPRRLLCSLTSRSPLVARPLRLKAPHSGLRGHSEWGPSATDLAGARTLTVSRCGRPPPLAYLHPAGEAAGFGRAALES